MLVKSFSSCLLLLSTVSQSAFLLAPFLLWNIFFPNRHVPIVKGAEVKTNVELIVPIGSVVIAMFLWLLIVFVIRGRKRVGIFPSVFILCLPFFGFSLQFYSGELGV